MKINDDITRPLDQEWHDFHAGVEKYLKEERYEEAMTLAETRLNRYPGDVDAWLVIATCWIGMDRLVEASEVLRNLDEVIRGWSRIYKHLGDTYYKKGLTREATEVYQKVANLSPEKRDHAAMADTDALSTGDFLLHDLSSDDAVSGIDEISSHFHTITLAELYIKQGHMTRARDVLKRIITRDPDNKAVLERLEYVEAMMGRDPINKKILVTRELNRWLENLGRRKQKNA